MEGARPFGVISGTPEETRVAFFRKSALDSFDWREHFGTGDATRLFRFGARCEESGCAHFGSGACRLGQRVNRDLPPVVDGHPLIDNEASRQLVDAARQQLAAVTSDSVVGMYGDAGQLPAFVIIAGTTTAGNPDAVLTGMASGFQQSLGSEELHFVDQPSGPLGGTMRCAEHSPMTTCMWTVDGAFGMNMVFQQDLAQAAATTLRVREAIETHAS